MANQNHKNQPKNKKQDNSDLKTYARYSYLGFQMAAFVLVFAGIGYWLDERSNSETPWWTIVLGLLGVFGGLYVTLRDFIKKDKD